MLWPSHPHRAIWPFFIAVPTPTVKSILGSWLVHSLPALLHHTREPGPRSFSALALQGPRRHRSRLLLPRCSRTYLPMSGWSWTSLHFAMSPISSLSFRSKGSPVRLSSQPSQRSASCRPLMSTRWWSQRSCWSGCQAQRLTKASCAHLADDLHRSSSRCANSQAGSRAARRTLCRSLPGPAQSLKVLLAALRELHVIDVVLRLRHGPPPPKALCRSLAAAVYRLPHRPPAGLALARCLMVHPRCICGLSWLLTVSR
mmetsp:Transcript_77314/g.217004  ORF Transcript_77314/g.217004 Transcript_77314/m.217004 type:complete len:257 (-) Transcript_77314:32-802(-)